MRATTSHTSLKQTHDSSVNKDITQEGPFGLVKTDHDLPATSRSLWYHIKTLFLFTKSDFKTVIFPQSVFALSAVFSAEELTTADYHFSESSMLLKVGSRLPHMLAWLWLNLLVEDIANQRTSESLIEDQINKPWRPLPSRRLTPEEARQWLLAAIVAAAGGSFAVGGYIASLSLMALIWMYNDLGGSGASILIRNALNAGGLMCFSWGALSVLSHGELLPRAYTWILATGSIIMTTVHAQDLPDQEGDKARGRRTAPLIYGQGIARWSLAIMVMFWSTAGPAFWGAPAGSWAWAVPLTIGATMAWLTLLRWGQKYDEVVWKLWCLWMTAMYVLPASVGHSV